MKWRPVDPPRIDYQSGFGNEFATESLSGALPAGRNSPQTCPYGLYAEQISGTAFTAPRHANRRSWLYRIRPSVAHRTFSLLDNARLNEPAFDAAVSPNQLRWDPLPAPAQSTDFVDGLHLMGGNGAAEALMGCRIYEYVANASMKDRFFYDADGELLVVPQYGNLTIDTEMGRLLVEPLEIAVIPRGLRFSVATGGARGYVCENFGAPFKLPDLGPIGSNGLANPRDFQIPVARYEDREGPCSLIAKFMDRIWVADMNHSPLDVVAWHGNHVPYKYDLRRFNSIGSISYDHPDPSIFLVLHAPSDTPGTSHIDFVIFPPRWLVAENTFRPPWFHRNVASEFMGLIHGAYDAKATGFVAGGASLHNCMSGHGPDARSYATAIATDTAKPQKLTDTMAFMFESRMVIKPSIAALRGTPALQLDYMDHWNLLEKRFDAGRP